MVKESTSVTTPMSSASPSNSVETKFADSVATRRRKEWWVPLLAGSVGGICLTVAGHPFDTLKVRAQTNSKRHYSGLFRGIGAPLTTTPLTFVTVYVVYALAEDFVSHTIPTGDTSHGEIKGQLPVWPHNVLAGALCALPLSFIYTSGEA